MEDPAAQNRAYWNQVADLYQSGTHISVDDFHYGPLLPGDAALGLLPSSVHGLRCLELGCGAGQNSIVLAKRGADCTAVDCAEAQLAHGRALAAEAGVSICFDQADMEALPLTKLGRFDLVHSTYALPFTRQPDLCIRTCFELLRPDGVLLLTTAHPVYAGEWAELTSGEEGVVLTNYFAPPDDTREAEEGHGGVSSRAVPLSTVFNWLREAGFVVDRIEEPPAMPIEMMAEAEIDRRVPYHSAAWRELHDVLCCIPVVAIFRCIRPLER